MKCYRGPKDDLFYALVLFAVRAVLVLSVVAGFFGQDDVQLAAAAVRVAGANA